MSRQRRERDPRSPWLIGVAEIAAYAEFGETFVNESLLSGELEGRQRKPGGTWRSKPEWVDAWIDSFGRRSA